MITDAAHHAEMFAWLRICAVRKKWYNWTYKDLSAATGLSASTLRRRMPVLLKLGWLQVHGQNLVITSNYKLQTSYTASGLQKTSPLIPIQIKRTKKEQIMVLRSIPIVGNLKRQERKVNKISNVVKIAKTDFGKLNKKQLTLIKNAGSLEKLAGSIDKTPNLSNKSIAALIGKSVTTARRLQKSLNEAGLIKSKHRFKEIATNVTHLEYCYRYLAQGIGLLYSPNTKTVLKRMSNGIEYFFAP